MVTKWVCDSSKRTCLQNAFSQSNCSIFLSVISLERIKWYLSCFSWSWSSSKGSIWKSSSLVGSCQVCLLCNQITWFFDRQYIGRESNDILVCFFLHVVSHQGKVASGTTTFGWMPSVKLLLKFDSRILWSTIFLKRISHYLSFFVWS